MTSGLRDAKVAVFGLGCVGSYTAELLAKNGVGMLELVDAGEVGLSGDGCYKTTGSAGAMMLRVDMESRRLHKLYPDTAVHSSPVWFTGETMGQFDFRTYDYVLDALDIPEMKALLAACVLKARVPLISCLDIKNCSNPTKLGLMPVREAPPLLVPAAVRELYKELYEEPHEELHEKPHEDLYKELQEKLSGELQEELTEENGAADWKVVCLTEYQEMGFHEPAAVRCRDCACPSEVALVCKKRRIKKSSCNVFVSAMAGMMAGEAILTYLAHREGGR